MALQTDSVLEICKVYHTIQKRWTLALQTYCVSLTFAKSTIQRYKASRVDAGVTSLSNA